MLEKENNKHGLDSQCQVMQAMVSLELISKDETIDDNNSVSLITFINKLKYFFYLRNVSQCFIMKTTLHINMRIVK